MKSVINIFLSLSILLCFASCSESKSKSEGTRSANGSVRMLNTIPHLDSVLVSIDGSSKLIRLDFGKPTTYDFGSSKEIEIRVFVDESPLVLHQQKYSLRSDKGDQTLVIFGDRAPRFGERYRITTKMIEDQHFPAVNQRFLVRVVNAAPNSNPFDVFVTRDGVAVTDSILPIIRGLGFRAGDQYHEGDEAVTERAIFQMRDSRTREIIYKSEVFNFNKFPVVTIYIIQKNGEYRYLVSLDSEN